MAKARATVAPVLSARYLRPKRKTGKDGDIDHDIDHDIELRAPISMQPETALESTTSDTRCKEAWSWCEMRENQ